MTVKSLLLVLKRWFLSFFLIHYLLNNKFVSYFYHPFKKISSHNCFKCRKGMKIQIVAINIEWQQQWLNSALIVPYPFHSWCIWVFQCVQWQVDSLAQSVSKSYYIKRWHQSMSQSSYSNTIIKQSYYSSKKWWGTKLNRCLLLLWMDIKLNTKHFILRQIKKK